MEQENKNSKAKSNILGILIMLCLAFSMIFLVIYFGTKLSYKLDSIDFTVDIPVFEENNENKNEPPVQNPSTDIFCLKEYNGKIAIYKNEALVYTIDKFIFTLPDGDKKLLKEGIYTTDLKEFYKILEQYY